MTLRSCILALAATAAFAAPAIADDRILVIPFNTMNVPANQQWIAQAAQESLVADLGQVKGLIPVTFSGQVIVEDNATAARLARTNNATFAIRGSAQVVGDNIRLTAQLIDAQSGDTLRTALVTGLTADLFKLEDDLTAQICGTTASPIVSPTTVAAVPATTATTSSSYVGPVVQPTPVIVENPAPQVVVVTQPEPIYYPTYIYSSYSYGWYPSDCRFDDRGWHDRDRDRDRDGRGGRGGDRDDRGRPGDRGGRGGPRPVNHDSNPNALPIPTTGALPIPTTGALPIPTRNDLPIPTRNVLPTAPKIDIPAPTRSTSPVPKRNLSPAPIKSAPPISTSNTPSIARSQPPVRPSPTVSMPAASDRVAIPTRSVVSPTPVVNSRSAVPAMSPAGPRAPGGLSRNARNVD
jgi:TolB-like protein